MTTTKNSLSAALRGANSVLRFLLELAALASLGVWGYQATSILAAQLLLAIAAPLAAAVLWGAFIAPRAPIVLPAAGRTALEVVVFGSATLALVALGEPVLATVLAALAVVNIVLLTVWGQWAAARAALVRPPVGASPAARRRAA
ncbi:DUF2568 domain-containing protein [Leifsonia poae]|uniref:DUF2568 domain-containing protein n=1 Tax=Leifsonia poae TaxID=110933 RepID=UPI001CBD1BEE|nr:DUF2568 domain-containing protein [Leifsonia poae]